MKGIDEEWTLEDAELAAYYLLGYLFFGCKSFNS